VSVCGANTYGSGIELKSIIPLLAPKKFIKAQNMPRGYVCSYKVIVTDKFIKSQADKHQFRSEQITHITINPENLK
jgi:hypothetical protein